LWSGLLNSFMKLLLTVICHEVTQTVNLILSWF